MSKEKKNNETKKKETKTTEEKETKVTKKQPKKDNKKEVTETKKEEKITKKTKKETEKLEEESFNEDEDFIIEEPIKKEEKIKKIEKIAKEKKANHKKKRFELNNSLDFFERNRAYIYGFAIGMLLTILVVIIIWPDRIATLEDGTQNVATIDGHNYTADTLYEDMKDYYSVSLLLDLIDTDILGELYEEDEEMTDEVNSNAEYYLSMYEQYYGYTEEQFLSENGFSSYEDFLDFLRLDYRRNKYLDDYIEENLEDSEIEDYYNENIFGDINCQHILVEVSSSDDDGKLSDEDAKALAEEIIDKLNDGTTWEDIQEEYADQITFEDLGYQSWDANLEDSFMTALKELEDNSYSTEPVETSYGYHVIYRLDQEEAPSLDDTREEIIDNLITDKKSEDSNLLYKALINLREENNLEFTDTVLKSKYDNYVKQYD